VLGPPEVFKSSSRKPTTYMVTSLDDEDEDVEDDDDEEDAEGVQIWRCVSPCPADTAPYAHICPKKRREGDELRWIDWKMSSTESPFSSAKSVEADSAKLPNWAR
jgi:hypothetical protein